MRGRPRATRTWLAITSASITPTSDSSRAASARACICACIWLAAPRGCIMDCIAVGCGCGGIGCCCVGGEGYIGCAGGGGGIGCCCIGCCCVGGGGYIGCAGEGAAAVASSASGSPSVFAYASTWFDHYVPEVRHLLLHRRHARRPQASHSSRSAGTPDWAPAVCIFCPGRLRVALHHEVEESVAVDDHV